MLSLHGEEALSFNLRLSVCLFVCPSVVNIALLLLKLFAYVQYNYNAAGTTRYSHLGVCTLIEWFT